MEPVTATIAGAVIVGAALGAGMVLGSTAAVTALDVTLKAAQAGRRCAAGLTRAVRRAVR